MTRSPAPPAPGGPKRCGVKGLSSLRSAGPFTASDLAGEGEAGIDMVDVGNCARIFCGLHRNQPVRLDVLARELNVAPDLLWDAVYPRADAMFREAPEAPGEFYVQWEGM